MLRRASACVILLVGWAVSSPVFTADTLPSALTDREFWALTAQLSEPDGQFVSRSGSPDNLLSNEIDVSTVAGMLTKLGGAPAVYLGVGPEQNFTYVAALHPRIAFITDIRRGNLDLHLVYKSVFEMSATRAEFVGRLFSRKPPAGLTTTMSAAQLMSAYLNATPLTESAHADNLQAILDNLTKRHGFALSATDRTNIEYVYRNFYRFGPAIDYTSSVNGSTGRFRSYATIMASVDRASGAERGFLANDANFSVVKTMESRNLIVPVVGDFAGPKALRAIGTWVRAHQAHVGVFYVSNVEQYLERNGAWPAFCANAAALPLTSASVFVRPGRGGAAITPMTADISACAK